MNFESDNFFNKYEVGDKLGHGHFAEVKRCTNKIDKNDYAAKFIRRRQLLDSKNVGMNLEEIQREANILKLLDHQNIIKLFFCYDLGKSIVLILELVSGGELFDHISDSEKLSEEEASEFIEQIVLGLNHMHEKNIVHLDLKPENVMIENLVERKIKLIDFGLAREIKNRNTIIEMQGTAEFLAPEVIEYNPISYATDMWAIGVITYIMLTGVSPFSGDDQISTFQNIVNCRLEFDEELCSDMTEMAKSFINSLLVLEPSKRAKASDCLIHPWIKPMEQSIMFRRRSSIISREKLQSLKHFVVSPSPPSSEETTPSLIRKYTNNENYFENVEESSADDDSIKLNSTTATEISLKKLSNSVESSSVDLNDSRNNELLIDNHNKVLNIDDGEVKNLEFECNKIEIIDKSNDSNTKVISGFRDNGFMIKEEDANGSPNEDYKDPIEIVPVTNEKVPKQKFNNAISNSVRKLNSKFDSITSLFDSKTKSNTPLKIQSRGSLKNLFSINSDSFFSNMPRTTSPSSSNQISTNSVKDSPFNTKVTSASVATSPTILKKSMFFNRYIAALESKKK